MRHGRPVQIHEAECEVFNIAAEYNAMAAIINAAPKKGDGKGVEK
jgi:hypothetical protein